MNFPSDISHFPGVLLLIRRDCAGFSQVSSRIVAASKASWHINMGYGGAAEIDA